MAMDPQAAGAAIYKAESAWRLVWNDLDPSAVATHYALEEAIGQTVAAGAAPATIRMWRGSQGISVAKKDIRSTAGQKAAKMMKEVGWPVYVRQSGGTAVPHGPGTLNFSLFLPRPREQQWSIEAIYRALGLPLQMMLADRFGLPSTFEAVPGSFCDGNFNVVIYGKKVAGTAQVWKGGPAGMSSGRPGYILAHATLLTHLDREAAVSALNAFYQLATDTRPVEVETVGTVQQFTNLEAEELDRMIQAGLLAALKELTGKEQIEAPSEAEWRIARSLEAHCYPGFYAK